MRSPAFIQLKDIAEVARIIDEVDDEEWLLVFIGELDHRLRYLMKLEEEGEEVDPALCSLRTNINSQLDVVCY